MDGPEEDIKEQALISKLSQDIKEQALISKLSLA